MTAVALTQRTATARSPISFVERSVLPIRWVFAEMTAFASSRIRPVDR